MAAAAAAATAAGSARLQPQILSLKLRLLGQQNIVPHLPFFLLLPRVVLWCVPVGWCPVSSVPAGLLALFTLRHRKYGRLVSASILLMGILGPITAGILTSAVTAAAY